MKKFILFAFIFLSLAASAQIPHLGYSPKVFSYGNSFNRASFDSALHFPNKPCLCQLDNDTTPQMFVYMDSLRYFWNGNYYNFGHGGGGGGGSYTADETSVHLTGSVFSIKSTWTGQNAITTLGLITLGTWNATPIADAYVSSSTTWNAKLGSALNSGQIFVGNGFNVATPASMSGDLSINNIGATALATTGVTAGIYTNANITIDAKGRVLTAANGTGGAVVHGTAGKMLYYGADASAYTMPVVWDSAFRSIRIINAYLTFPAGGFNGQKIFDSVDNYSISTIAAIGSKAGYYSPIAANVTADLVYNSLSNANNSGPTASHENGSAGQVLATNQDSADAVNTYEAMISGTNHFFYEGLTTKFGKREIAISGRNVGASYFSMYNSKQFFGIDESGNTRFPVVGTTTLTIDTTTYKPVVMDASGNIKRMYAGWGGGGGGGVSAFNTRSGAVVSLVGDYNSFYPVLSGTYSDPAWITGLSASKILSSGALTASSSKVLLTGVPATSLLQNVGIDIVPANILLSTLGGSLNFSQLNATGTPSATTYYRGDGSWSATIDSGISTIGNSYLTKTISGTTVQLGADTSSGKLATKSDVFNNVTIYTGSDLKIGTINTDSLYAGGKLLRDAHHTGSSLWKHYWDSTSMIVTQPVALLTPWAAWSAINTIPATAGNSSYGGAFLSQGNFYNAGTNTWAVRHYAVPDAGGAASSGKYVFESMWNGSLQQSMGQIENGPTGFPGGTAHFGVGQFGSINLGYAEKTGAYSMSTGDHYINCLSGTFTTTLPNVTSTFQSGPGLMEYVVTNTGSGTITVGTTSSQNIIYGATTATTFVLAQGQYAKFVGNATSWTVLETNAITTSGTPVTNVQEFSGTSGTWTKPANAKMVRVLVIGGGGGGGSGRKGAAASLRTGGGGGGGGGWSEFWFNASDLPATVAYVSGASVAGGVSQATNSTNGTTGTSGITSSFGAYLVANGGNGGGFGNASGAGTAGGGANGYNNQINTGNGAASDPAGGGGGSGNNVILSPSGGGSGGGITVGNVANNGGFMGSIGSYTNPANTYSTSFAQGQAGFQAGAFPFGTGGSGTAGSTTGAPSTGGAGIRGGGGAGGGASTDAVGNSGAGGAGGAGLVRVETYF